MERFNLNHLYYFWMVAREGGVTNACRKLNVAQPTVSAQIIQLERVLGRALFHREGKRLVLTEDGELVLDYSNQMFGYMQEMLETLRGRPARQNLVIRLGVVDQVSKQIVQQLTTEIYDRQADAQVIVTEGTLQEMLERLRVHALDLLLSNIDVPAEETGDFLKTEAGHLPISFVASPGLARNVKSYPEDLSRVPMLLPTRASPIWRGVEHFLNQHRIEPRIVAEVQGVELLRLMAIEGRGVAPMNTIAAAEDIRERRLVRINPTPTGIHKTIWLIAKKRHRLDPLVVQLLRSFRIPG